MGVKAVQDRSCLSNPASLFLGLHVSQTIDVAELSPLQRAHYYRRLSEDAARQARGAPDETMRSAYEFLAEHWLKLAHMTQESAGMREVTMPGWEMPVQDPVTEER
jgi:hypothetical protein